MLCGVLDKNQFGATAYGLVHSAYEMWGPAVAGQLLSSLSRVFTGYLRYAGFTCGVDDALIEKPSETIRSQLLKEAMDNLGDKVASEVRQKIYIYINI